MSPRKAVLAVAAIVTVALGVASFFRAPDASLPAPLAHATHAAETAPEFGSSGPSEAALAAAPLARVDRLAKAVRGEASAQFYRWASSYLAADAAERPRLTAEGVRLAEARRPEFRELIRENPRRALEEAVPMVVRQELPERVVQRLEERLNGVAALRVYLGAPLPGEPLPKKSLTVRKAEFQNGKTYAAHVYGARAAKVTWTPGASLNGVAIDADFAVNEQPSRLLEIGEIPNPAKPQVTVCPISGKSTGGLEEGEKLPEAAVAVETATEILHVCGQMHIDPVNQTLIMGEGVSGGAFGFTGILPSAPTPALGNVKVLAIPMTFEDQNTVPSTEAALYSTLRDVGDFYAKASYGRISLVGVVTPPVKLPHNEAWYVNRDTSNGGDIDGEGLEHLHAREEARKLGFDSNDYDCIVVRHNGGPGSYGGLGGGSSVWVRSDGVALWAHEIGHCFGLMHANFWDTAGTSAIGAGTNAEYGDSYDIMGGGPYPAGHYNAQGKSQIRWLPADFVQNVTQSGVYRIYAFDQSGLLPERRYALSIVKDAQKTYWGELRSLYETNPWVKNGLLLGWRYPSGGATNLQRIDTTPGSPFGKEDAAIAVGRTFSDDESGIHLTTLAVNESPRYVDVAVNFGAFANNRKPALSLAASATVVPVGATVTFTATASDPDGDPLGYYWQHFGDTNVKLVSGNSPVITRTFGSAGTYVVSCTANDQRGGSTTRSQLITVGNGNGRFAISGRVTYLGQGLQDVVVTANGSNGVVTDADGYYTIPNLAANTYTLTPLLYGYTFAELFNNSVVVGPTASGADFEATPTPTVSIAATQAAASEASPVTAGQFTLTRTGDTSLALVVNVAPAQGSAGKGTDYTFSPDYVSGAQGFSTFTIPAGSATLTVALTPLVDAIPEGPETATLQLGPGNGYLVDGNSTATIVIADDEVTVPRVSVAVTQPSTVEDSGQPATVTVTRTGATTSALTLSYTASGTAGNGADFEALSGSVTIPEGAGSATIQITPIDDSASEPLETVRLALTPAVAYFIDPGAGAATVNLVDDDVQTVTVVASDASAAEVNPTAPGAMADTGTFLVTRSGDTSNPLTVYYAVTGTPQAGVTALHGVDYEALPGVLTIPAGAAQAAVTIIPRFDGIGEGPETVLFTLGAGSTNYVLGAASSATVTIADASDLPYVDIVQVSNAAEPSTSGQFRITARGGSGTGTLTVNYTVSGTATSGVDFTAPSGALNLTLNNGATVTGTVTVTPINDAVPEPLETVTVTLTPSANYQTYAPTSAATMWLREDDQPTVFVDTQVGTNGSSTITEGGSMSTVKFYISRTGSTASALDVNYVLGGTATAGSDYAAVTGTVSIPAGALGVDVPISVINDTAVEGTETITFDFAAGSYAGGPGTVMYIADNEVNPQTVSFSSTGSGGVENVGVVNIPVTLASAAAGPVTVEYAVDSGTRVSASANGSLTQALPYWVRLVKVGTTFTSFASRDGQGWTMVGSPQTLSGFTATSFLAGLCVTSRLDGTLGTATFDNLTISDLSPGGAQGAIASADIGPVASMGSYSLAGSTYTVAGSGADIAGTVDEFRYVWVPISNSGNCTITARVLSQTNTHASAKAGVMIRESTAVGARHAMTVAMPSPSRSFQYRASTNGSTTTTATSSQLLAPYWVRLQRAGDVFTAAQSPDGTAWTNVGTAQTIVLAPNIFAGLAASARSDGQVTTATFDQVAISGSPVLAGRTVGFVNVPGADSLAGGTYTVSASGAGIGGTEDECHFVAAPMFGDFTISARVASQTGGAGNAQAGVMIRESTGFRARSLYLGSMGNGGAEFIWRNSTVTTAQGSGVDYSLPSGVLTFAAGEQTKSIPLAVVDDSMVEPNNTITVVLRNPNGAQLGAISQHTVTIMDNDAPAMQPHLGFASPVSSVPEGAGVAQIPVTLSAPATTLVLVSYTVTGGTATSGGDFTLAAGLLTFSAGETVKSIPVTILQDTTLELPETVTVELSNPLGAQFNSLRAHVQTITDDDAPVVTVTASDPSAAESGDPGAFTFTRSGSTDAALTVNFTRSGSASAPGDYTDFPSATSIQFPAGQASVSLAVSPVQDTSNEGSETVIVTLAASPASPPGYAIGSPAAATVTLADDDRNQVNIVATDADASEAAGNTARFTLTRSGSAASALTVPLTVSGTATIGTDYTAATGEAAVGNVTTSVVFGAGQATRTIVITPLDDQATEGSEQVTVALGSGTFDLGPNSFASATIADNDSPPTLFISSPSTQGALVASGNGIILTATVTDDGFPSALGISWSVVAGPGTAAIESPTMATTAVTFSTPGTYVVRVTATDGQFSVSDQATVVAGADLTPANWISMDLGPSSSRRGQGLEYGGLFSVSGTGAGYTGSADQAQVMVRSVDGDLSIVARITSVQAASGTPLAGVTIRDTMMRGARRAVLGFAPGAGLQFRTRTTVNASDASVAQAVTLPVWVRLARNATTHEITASYANDVAGAPGAWTQLGSPTVVAMDARAVAGLTTTSNSTSVTAAALLDNVTLTPAPSGPALLSEDFGTTPGGTGSASVTGGTYTLAGSTTGYYYGWQYYGDLMITARHVSATSGAGSATSGIRISETLESGAFAHVGRIPTGSYSGYYWRALAGGGVPGVPSFTGASRWVRIIRQGNSITAFHAPDVAGAPGTWAQLGQPQTVIMTTPVFVGFWVDNASGVGLNTVSFSNLSIVPLNRGPNIGITAPPAYALSPLGLDASVTDDNFPAPPALTTAWSKQSGPGTVTFGNPTGIDTTVSFSLAGDYTLRLRADDGSAATFRDLKVGGYLNGFDVWRGQQFAAQGGLSNPASAPTVDPDGDGVLNVAEFAFGTSPTAGNSSPVSVAPTNVGGQRYLQLTTPKNPAAGAFQYVVEACNALNEPWTSDGLIIEANTSTLLQVRDTVPLGSQPQRFLRLRIVAP